MHPPHAETQTDQALQSAFKESTDAFYAISYDPRFSQLCMERGISIEAWDQPEYWQVTADFARQRSDEQRREGKEEREIALQELYSITPNYLYTQVALDHGSNLPRHEKRLLKEEASYFNGLVRHTARLWPGMSVRALSTHLLNAANKSIEDKDLKQHAAAAIRTAIHGARHEAAFGQILAHTGRSFREATVEEDLSGIDYVVERPDGGVDFIDVKASLSEIEHLGGVNAAYAVRDGKLVMYSLVTDKELGDRFQIRDDHARQKAAALIQLLDQPNSAYSVG